ncbi:uncharacterized protein LOC112493934 [Cephus cinctus]|uniref:Uncharacterized protein LOC112493934 n=1 Tax=Cephus cinctus TaxID=211228 RepID=A0AAJ7VYY3_CEPCN|nr:uncharacterized protein LOC112493934 [Cephus cinctus]
MKIKFCVLPICLWNVLLVSTSSSEVVKRSSENFDSGFKRNLDGPTDHYHSHRYHLHYHRRPHSGPNAMFPPSPPFHQFHPRPNNRNTPPKKEVHPWRIPEFEPPEDYHHPEKSFGEPTWEQNPSDTWPSSTDSSPATNGYTDFDMETKESQDEELLPDCHCKFQNVGSRTIVTVSVKTMSTPSTATSTSTTTSTTMSTSSTSSTTEFDWNKYVEKELSEDFSKNNSAGIGLIDVRQKEVEMN